MNKNNISWVDNKVFSVPAVQSIPSPPSAPAQPPPAPLPSAGTTGLSPAFSPPPEPTLFPAALPSPSAGAGPSQTALTRDESYAASPLSFQGAPTVLDQGYTPAYLRTQLGKRVRAEFNIGSDLYTDRTGILREVGISYFVLEDLITRAMIMCDLYSMKFLTSL